MNWTEQDYAAHVQRMGPVAEVVKRKRRKITSEAEIERVCTQVLIHDGWRPLKTDPVSNRRRGKGFGELGMADYIYVRYGDAAARVTGSRLYALSIAAKALCEVLWIEHKREDGEAKPHQLKWHAEERAKGALTLIAGIDFEASVDGFMKWYDQSGLRRATR